MRVLTCPAGNFDQVSGQCDGAFWQEIPLSPFAGWGVAEMSQVVGALLTLAAVVWVIRVVVRWAESQ